MGMGFRAMQQKHLGHSCQLCFPGAGCRAEDMLLCSQLGFSKLTEEAQKFRGEAVRR